MIYLASPYSHENTGIVEQRFNAVCRLAARLIHAGEHVFSPIAHCHHISKAGKLLYDVTMIAACDRFMVAMLDGWKESKGVQAEIQIAKKLGRTIEYMAVAEASTAPVCQKKRVEHED